MRKTDGLILSFLVASSAFGLVPSEAQAQAAPSDLAEDDAQHQFGITFSPVHLASPMIEITGEYRLADKMGVAVVVGVGRVKLDMVTSSGTIDRFRTGIEGGAQFRYYLIGSFIHGMQLGAEVLYTYVDRDETDSVADGGDGFAVGPFIGYKIATNIGFTFDAQLGFQNVTTPSAWKDEKNILPMVNLNVGWSF